MIKRRPPRRCRVSAFRHRLRRLVCRIAGILVLATAGLVILLARAAAPRRSVLLITLDSVRADALGVYGDGRETTPNLDTFARRCYLFTRAFGQSYYTGPSHSAILTSLYPRAHGAFTNEHALDRAHPHLATYFRDRGYRTAAFVNVGLLGRPLHYDEGFGVFEEHDGDGTVLAPAVAWLAAQRHRPFLCWVHFNDAHSPYTPPPLFDHRFLRGPPPARQLTAHDALYDAWHDRTLTPEEVRWAKDRYDAEVRSLDSQVGLLLARAQAAGLLRRTIVLVTADHGEGFNREGGRFGHGYYLYDDVLRVPLLLYVPQPPYRLQQTRRMDALVQGVDLAPTLIELTGGRIPRAFQGSSLVPLLNGARRMVHKALILGVGWERQPVAVRTTQWKFINDTNQPPDELYDVTQDPGETRNLRLERPELVQHFADVLQRWRERIPEYAGDGSRPSGTVEEVRALMRKAGYLSHDAAP